MLVGAGVGLTAVSPFSNEGVSLETVTASTAIWLVVVQWLSALLGGYLAGRLRTRWVNVHTDEVFFRDTAHGFLVWALATLLVAGLLSSTISAMLGTGVQAASNVAGGAAMGGAAAAGSDDGNTGYFVDTLLRPADPANPVQGDEQASAEVSRILLASAASGEMEADDRAYLEKLIAARTGLTPEEVKARVDAVLSRVDEAAQQANRPPRRRAGPERPSRWSAPCRCSSAPSSRAPQQRSAGGCGTTTKVPSTSDRERHGSAGQAIRLR